MLKQTSSRVDLLQIERLLVKLHGESALASFEELRATWWFGAVAGEVILDGKQHYFTKATWDDLSALCGLVFRSFDVMEPISRDDIWAAIVPAVKASLASSHRTTSAKLLEDVRTRVESEIRERILAAGVSGLSLVDLDEISFGRTKIQRTTDAFISSIPTAEWMASSWKESIPREVWFLGTYAASETAADNQFAVDAAMVTGLLAVLSTACFDNAFSKSPVSIHINSLPEHRPVTTVRWEAGFSNPTANHKWNEQRPLEISAELLQYFRDQLFFDRFCSILQAQERTEVEEAVARSVFWFDAAYSDCDPVMQFVKLWSCVEAFFSITHEGITERNATGLTTLLVFGGYDIVKQDEFEHTKKQLKRLYALRSKAVHRAEHRHIDSKDIAVLSRWVAWCIVTMVSITEKGYTELTQVWTSSSKFRPPPVKVGG